MTKDQLIKHINKAIEDGNQSDYDRVGNLVDYFNQSEVVEKLESIIDTYAESIAIEFARFIWGEFEESGTVDDMKYTRDADNPTKYYTAEDIYNQFLKDKNNHQ